MSAHNQSQLVTVIYYEEASLVIKHDVKSFEIGLGGRVVLPASYKQGKSIIAVCEGKVNFLNKVGDRVLPAEQTDNTEFAELSFH